MYALFVDKICFVKINYIKIVKIVGVFFLTLNIPYKLVKMCSFRSSIIRSAFRIKIYNHDFDFFKTNNYYEF